MNKKLWTVPLLSSIGGIVWRIVMSIEMRMGLVEIIDTEGTIDSETMTFELISLCNAAIIILIIGIILWCKSLDKKTIAKSATLLVAYIAIIIICDLLTGGMLSYYFHLPFWIYENLASWLFVKLNSALDNQVNGWIYYIYIFLPYIYVLLGRKKKQV